MPELPDVENYRRHLEATALRGKIAGVEVASARVLRGVSGRKLAAALSGRRPESTRRHGKQLLAALDDGAWLTLHFGMTGRLARYTAAQEPPRHERLRLDFAGGGHLAFVDQRLLGRVGLAAKASSHPPELSGGERQRVAIARALATRPMILLADEPTGNIDPATSIGIMKVLDRINRTGTTVVMATHDADIVDSMRKRVIELEEGVVIRDQTRGVYGQAY